MDTLTLLEQRVTVVEQTVVALQHQLHNGSDTNWLHRVAGSVTDDEVFQEALAHGRAFRTADHPDRDALPDS